MKTLLRGAASACLIAVISQSAQAVAVSGQGTWESTLQGRDLDGDPGTYEAYYDTRLDITWLADASYAATTGFAFGGRMNWGTTRSWAMTLNVNGVSGWRLPTMLDTGTRGCNYGVSGTDCGFNVQTGSAATTVYSEMASLFYDTLGNKARIDTNGNSPQPGYGLSNTGPFSNFQSTFYWSGLLYAPDITNAWTFRGGDGLQNRQGRNFSRYAMVVRSGDVNPVPVPAAVWLFGSGLIGLISLARRKTLPSTRI